MPRKAFHQIKRSRDVDSIGSTHGSEYNADAACPRITKMGPSHNTLCARHAIEQSHAKPSLPLYVISEIDEEDTVVSVSVHDLGISNLSDCIRSLESRRRSADKRLRKVQGFVDEWKEISPNRRSFKEDAERYQAAEALQDALAKLMDFNRQTSNKCCELMYGCDRYIISSEQKELQTIERKLQEIAVDIETTQNEVESERKRTLASVKELRSARHGRRHKGYL